MLKSTISKRESAITDKILTLNGSRDRSVMSARMLHKIASH
ncbi:hypothetical protein [Nostoc sp.]